MRVHLAQSAASCFLATILLLPCSWAGPQSQQLSHEFKRLQQNGVQTPHILFVVPEAPQAAEGGLDSQDVSEEVASSEERGPVRDLSEPHFVGDTEPEHSHFRPVRFQEPVPGHVLQEESPGPLPEQGPPYIQEPPGFDSQYVPQRPIPHLIPSVHGGQVPHGKSVILDFTPKKESPNLGAHTGPYPNPHPNHNIQNGDSNQPAPGQDFVILRIFNDSSQSEVNRPVDWNISETIEAPIFRESSNPVELIPNLTDDASQQPEQNNITAYSGEAPPKEVQLIANSEIREPRLVLPIAEITESADIVGGSSADADKGSSSGGDLPASDSISSESTEQPASKNDSPLRNKTLMISIATEASTTTTVSTPAFSTRNVTEVSVEQTSSPPSSQSEMFSMVPDTLSSSLSPSSKSDKIVVYMSNGPFDILQFPSAQNYTETKQIATEKDRHKEISSMMGEKPTNTSEDSSSVTVFESPSELEPVVIQWSEGFPDHVSSLTSKVPVPTSATTASPIVEVEKLSSTSVRVQLPKGNLSIGLSLDSDAEPTPTSAHPSLKTESTTNSSTTLTEATVPLTTELEISVSRSPGVTDQEDIQILTSDAAPTTIGTMADTVSLGQSNKEPSIILSSSTEPTTASFTTLASTTEVSLSTEAPQTTETPPTSSIATTEAPTTTDVSATTTAVPTTTTEIFMITQLPTTTQSPTSSQAPKMSIMTTAPTISITTTPAPITTNTTTTTKRLPTTRKSKEDIPHPTSPLPTLTLDEDPAPNPTDPNKPMSFPVNVADSANDPVFDYDTIMSQASSTTPVISAFSTLPSPAYVPTESTIETSSPEVTANEIGNDTAFISETTAEPPVFDTSSPPSVAHRGQRPIGASNSPFPTDGPPKYYELPTDRDKPSTFPTQTIRTRNGQMKGIVFKTSSGIRVNSFLGIPYAQPPINGMRFERPMEFPPWTGVFEAKKMPKSCPQPSMQLNGFVGVNMSETSEDCLYLNIWSPFCDGSKKCRSRPVVVYIHGGGFVYGGVNWPIFDGAELAGKGDIVVVTVNYRLGALGFLYIPSNGGRPERANMGLYDQHLALRWVKSNIKAFGGDHSKITVMGQDAGAASVGYHILTPRSTGLFKRAVMQSGSPFSFVLRNTKDQGETLFRSLASYTDCLLMHGNSSLRYDDVLTCMKKLPFESIITASEKFNGKGANSFFPILGEEFIPMNPKDSLLLKRFSNVDLLVSTAKLEGAFFLQHFLSPFTNIADADSIKPEEIIFYLRVFLSALLGGKPTASLNQYTQNTEPKTRSEKVDFLRNISAVIGDYPFVCATTEFGTEYANLRHNVYHMQFDHRPWFLLHPTWFSATHFDDVMFWLGAMYKLKERSRSDERVADELTAILTSFANKGTPQTLGKLTWPRINQGGYFMNVASEFTELLRTPPADCNYWTRHFPQY
ncbi:uncharacterized protein LOC111267456 isoform X2 [Varroa jacobsoni]|nr:uncharacterized protein LOC111267456 isoform X2 [Varroa jacobsoni]